MLAKLKPCLLSRVTNAVPLVNAEVFYTNKKAQFLVDTELLSDEQMRGVINIIMSVDPTAEYSDIYAKLRQGMYVNAEFVEIIEIKGNAT